jgi:hypothetical protein
MSKFVKVKTELRDATLIKQALDDLKLSYGEDARFSHLWSGFRDRVPFVVNDQGIRFGLRQTEGGAYEAIGDDLQLRRVRPLIHRIQQRYAYHKVRLEVEKAGFDLVEEQVGKDNVIRMTVRRWQ